MSTASRVAHLAEMLGVIVPAAAYDDASQRLLKKNYLWVCRMVHPDKCQELHTVEAFRAVDDAFKAYESARPALPKACVSLPSGGTPTHTVRDGKTAVL
eukprot:1216657-Prymnesium_polylepis.4